MPSTECDAPRHAGGAEPDGDAMALDSRTAHLVQQLTAAFGSEVFSLADALAAGITREQMRHAARTGALVRTRRGWYAVAATPAAPSSAWSLPPEAQATVHLLTERGARPVIGGVHSGRWWSLDMLRSSDPPLVLVDPETGVRPGLRNGVLIRHVSLPDSHVTPGPDGLHFTSALRTGIDCARQRDPAAAFIVLNSAIRRSLDPTPGPSLASLKEPGFPSRATGRSRLSAHDLTAVASDPRRAAEAMAQAHDILHSCRGHGLRSVRAVLPHVDPRLETALESLSWWRFIEMGMDLPIPQYWIDCEGSRYRVDFWFGRVIGEADGLLKYQDRRDVVAEKLRQEALEGAGYRLVRWTWDDMWARPEVTLARIASTLSRRHLP